MGERFLSRSRGHLTRWITASLERGKRKGCFQKGKVEKVKISKMNQVFSLEARVKNLDDGYRCGNQQQMTCEVLGVDDITQGEGVGEEKCV